MKKLNRSDLLLGGKRLLIYVVGLYLMAIGVVFSSKSSLGVSPVSSLGNVLFRIGQGAGAPAWVNLGNCTTAVFCLYLVVELLFLGKNFKPAMLLQIVVSLLFGQLVHLATAMLHFLPAPGSYAVQMLYLLISVPLVAAGVLLYLTPNLFPMPGEGLSIAIADKFGISVGTAKTIFDCSVVLLSVFASLFYFRALVGVREGTVICALLVGFVFRLLQKPFQKPLLQFVARESKVDRALEAASQGYLTDLVGKPKIIITIGREFGSGGRELGKHLAEKLGCAYYDREIITAIAERSKLAEDYVNQVVENQIRSYYPITIAVSMVPAPEDSIYTVNRSIFSAQSEILEELAQKSDCVIVGRCADHILAEYNPFRVYVYADMAHKIARCRANGEGGAGLTDKELEKRIRSVDKARAQYYRFCTGESHGDRLTYDLGINTSSIAIPDAVAAIAALAGARR